MTIGIGGWGSRRKPMSLVRAIARSPVTDLTVVSYGGPDVGLLCAAGKVKRVVYAFVSLDSIPLEPHFRAARQAGAVETRELDEGMFLLGLQAAAWRVPFLPTRAGLGSDVVAGSSPSCARCTSPYDRRRGELVAVPALDLDVALVHMNRGDAGGNGQYLGADPYFDDLFCMAADAPVHARRAGPADTEDLAGDGPGADAADQPAHGRRRGRGAERRALHRRARPTTSATRRSSASTPRPREDARGVGRVPGDATSTCGGHDEYRKAVGL